MWAEKLFFFVLKNNQTENYYEKKCFLTITWLVLENVIENNLKKK